VHQSGGYLSVYSEPGYGTIFKIYLPQVQEQAPAPPRISSAPTPEGSETILLVEDEDLVRRLALEVLHKHRYTVLTAPTGLEALRVAATYPGPIDLVITDVIMPGGLSGPQLIQQLLAQRPTVKVLYISGYTDEAIVHHGVLEAGLAFLQKPFSPATLARKVRDILDTVAPGGSATAQD
jgi:DNA-binding response OmpR family regulator